jgi:hypothetical protein
MGGKSRLMQSLRNQHWYALVTAALRDCGVEDYEFVPATGRGYPKLVVRYKGRELRSPVPSSERGHGDHKYLVARIRRFIGETERAAA